MYTIDYEKCKKLLKELSDFIYENPELANEEFKSCERNFEFFSGLGLDCSKPYPEVPTAFQASYGQGDVEVVFMSEYDALAELGHGCGHNLIAAAAAAGFLRTAQIMAEQKIPGRIVILGTPAEEGAGGKVDLLRCGAFKNSNLALISHPFYCSCNAAGGIAVSRFDVEFHGKSAHAAISPEQGINALDAMITLFNQVGLYRQQMSRNCLMHGIITHGGAAPNIIPDYTEAFFYLRSYVDEEMGKLKERFVQMVEGAALGSGCKFKIIPRENPYFAGTVNPVLHEFQGKLVAERLENYRLQEGYISSDLSNVSNVIPTSNFFFSAVEDGREIPLHSVQFQHHAGSKFAFESALKSGEIMSETAIEFLSNKEFRSQVENAFKK